MTKWNQPCRLAGVLRPYCCALACPWTVNVPCLNLATRLVQAEQGAGHDGENAALIPLITNPRVVLWRAVVCCRFPWSAHGLQLSSARVVLLHQ